VAAYDQWYGHARIMYLVSGLIEGTLRSRLNQRLTEMFGPEWPSNDDAVPSLVRKADSMRSRAERMEKVEGRLARADTTSSPGDATALVADLRAIVATPFPSQLSVDGATFLAGLTLASLLSFFTTKRLHSGTSQLKELLRDASSNTPISLQQVQAEFETYRKTRNNVAHYVLGAELSFVQALFNAARIASWLSVDLQHFYGSVDARQSTELSRLLGPRVRDLAQAAGNAARSCEEPDCTNGLPDDWMLVDRTPRDGAELQAGVPVRRACLQHRVTYRVRQHQHVGF